MRPLLVPFLAVCLAATGAAQAQYPGGGGGGGHGHGRGGHGGGGQGGGTPAAGAGPARAKPSGPPEIVGVVKSIDTANGRLTIAYEAVEDLNWPAGTMPFVVAKTALLQSATVGEKISFRIENQEIVALRPWTARPPAPDTPPDRGHGPPGGAGPPRP
jgi:Cu/Ag efflux protein CusF